jgi:hypothetical protein
MRKNSSCSRAPEDFARELPKAGGLNDKIIVPNLLGINLPLFLEVPPDPIFETSFIDTSVPFDGKVVVLPNEFSLLRYSASLSSSDLVQPVPFIRNLITVKEQDPPGGSLVPRDTVVKLKLKTARPPGV